MLLGKIDDSIVNIDTVLKSKSCVKLLGINIDHKLNFSEHVLEHRHFFLITV